MENEPQGLSVPEQPVVVNNDQATELTADDKIKRMSLAAQYEQKLYSGLLIYVTKIRFWKDVFSRGTREN